MKKVRVLKLRKGAQNMLIAIMIVLMVLVVSVSDASGFAGTMFMVIGAGTICMIVATIIKYGRYEDIDDFEEED